MNIERLLSAPVAQVLADPEVAAVVADRPCAQLDRLLVDLLMIDQEPVAGALLVAHLEVGSEEPGCGHDHLLDDRREAIPGAVEHYLHAIAPHAG